jgi:mRNA interferase RelE/StbE
VRYSVEFKPSAARQLSKLPRLEQVRIGHRIEALSVDPRPHGVEKIKGAEDLFRIRVGDYRVVYALFDDRLLILIVKVGHRREVYRGF